MWHAPRGRLVPRGELDDPISDSSTRNNESLHLTLIACLTLGLHVALLIPIIAAAVDEADPEIIDQIEKMAFVNIIGTLLLGTPLIFPKKHHNVYDEHLCNIVKLLLLGGAFVFHITSAYLCNGFVKDANVKVVVALVILVFALIAETFNIVLVYMRLLFTWNGVKDSNLNITNSIPLIPM